MISNVKQKVFHPLLSVSAAHNWRTFQVHSLFCARNSKNTIFTHHFLFWVFQLPQYASVPGWDTTWWNARSLEQTAGGSQISEDRYMMDAHIKDSVFHRHLADFYNLSQVCNRWSSLHSPDEYMLGGVDRCYLDRPNWRGVLLKGKQEGGGLVNFHAWPSYGSSSWASRKNVRVTWKREVMSKHWERKEGE